MHIRIYVHAHVIHMYICKLNAKMTQAQAQEQKKTRMHEYIHSFVYVCVGEYFVCVCV
jgi:hypothetical protein